MKRQSAFGIPLCLPEATQAVELFLRHFNGATRLSGIMEKERTALTALAHTEIVLVIGITISVPDKNATSYDGTAGRNS
jgi:phage tail protein X